MGSVTDEACRGAIGDLRAFQQPGLKTLRRYIRGELPPPPISRLLGMRATEAGIGKATFMMPVTRWLEDGFGLYWGGIYALLADAPLAWAIWTTLPAGKSVTTAEVNLSFVRPMSRQTKHMIGRAETVHTGARIGLSTVQITGDDGRLLAFGSTRCLVGDVAVEPEADYPVPVTGPDDSPDPWQRPAPDDGYFSLDEVMRGVPIGLQRITIGGGKTFPVWRLSGFRPASVGEGRFEARLPASAWFSNGSQSIYGGMLAWAAEFAMGAAVYSMLGPGDIFATLDMHIRFTRPARIDSGELSLIATVQHHGRQLRIVSCEINDAAGKRIAMATSSALVVSGGVRELGRGRLPEEILTTDNGG